MEQVDIDKQFTEELRQFLIGYDLAWSKPVPLYIVNRRFGVRYKKASKGIPLRTLLDKNRELFEEHILESGAVALGIRIMPDIDAMVLRILEERGGVANHGDIAAALSGSGYKHMDLIDSLTRLVKARIVSREDDAYTFNTAKL